MTKKDKINLAADFAVDLISEVIHMFTLDRLEKRLNRQIQVLRDENMELKARLAKLEQKSGTVPTEKDDSYVGTSFTDQTPRARFRIHANDGTHSGQVNMEGRDFVHDAMELNQAIAHAHDLIERNFKDASHMTVVSDKTGARYYITFSRKSWPKANVSITAPTGQLVNMGRVTIGNAGKFILDYDKTFPNGHRYEIPAGISLET